LVYDWVKEGRLESLRGYTTVQREVKFGDSRFDVFAENEKERCFIEVKNVTLKDGVYARFPDAVTQRGRKHLETLLEVKRQGMRAVMVFVIQRMDVDLFAPAWNIDPVYAETLIKVYEQGVEVIPVQVKVSPEEIDFYRILPFRRD
jgi:sugar fermentation stimulation protein A